MIIVPDIRCMPDEPAALAKERAAALLGVREGEIKRAVVTRESIDARHRKVVILRSIGFELFGDEAEKLKNCEKAKLAKTEEEHTHVGCSRQNFGPMSVSLSGVVPML